MGKNKEKIVYKTNKKLLKRLLIGMLIIFLVMIFATPIKNGVELLYLKSWTWHEIENFDFSIKLPRAYKAFDVEDDDQGITSSIFNTEVSVEVNEEYVSKVPETVYSGGNILNGVSLMIQCLETERTTKTLDDIAESHHVLVKIYYEDEYEIGELNKEFVEVLGENSVKTIIDMKEKDATKTLITYLVPLKDKEITLMFLGNKDNISNSMNEIEKIVNKMK